MWFQIVANSRQQFTWIFLFKRKSIVYSVKFGFEWRTTTQNSYLQNASTIGMVIRLFSVRWRRCELLLQVQLHFRWPRNHRLSFKANKHTWASWEEQCRRGSFTCSNCLTNSLFSTYCANKIIDWFFKKIEAWFKSIKFESVFRKNWI